MSEIEKSSDVASLTVQLLSAYLANNTVPAADIAELIRTTRAALTGEEDAVPEVEEPVTYTPAVSIRKSLASPDYIISLIDGKPYKVLKRHLATNGLDADSYRERYNLPASYPMVAPTFAAHRRAIAEKIGLGTRKSSDADVSKKAVRAKSRKVEELSPSVSDGASEAETVKPAVKAPRKRQPKTSTAKAPSAKAKTISFESVTSEAVTTKRQKLGLFGRS